MKLSVLLFMLLLCIGCAGVKTSVLWHDGQEIVVNSKSDAKVVYKKGDESIEVDNRGRPGFIEQVFGAMLLRTDDLKGK